MEGYILSVQITIEWFVFRLINLTKMSDLRKDDHFYLHIKKADDANISTKL